MPRLPPAAKRMKAKGKDESSRYHSSYDWTKRSKSYRQIQPICERCKYLGQLTQESCEKVSVHHIVSIENDSSLMRDEDNFLTLCIPCHSRYTVMENSGNWAQSEQEGQEVKGL